MNNFEYYSPTRVLFGADTVDQIGSCVRSFGGTHALIVYGSERAHRQERSADAGADVA